MVFSAIAIALCGVIAAIPSVYAEDSFVPVQGPSSDEPTTVIVPASTGSNDAEGGVTLVPANAGSNSDENSPATPPSTETPPGSNGGSSSGGSSSSGSSVSSGSGSVAVSSTGSVLGASTSCPLITTYMKLGANNDSAEVARLQAFLRNTEQLDVDISGIFDAKTEAAVKAFQEKFLSETMGPWGGTIGSGIVYITTMKKINQIACNQPLVLSAEDQAIINAYISNDNTTGNGIGSTASTSSDIGDNESQNSNIAAAAGASILSRLWAFIKSLFF